MKLTLWIWLACSVISKGDLESSYAVTCNSGKSNSSNGSDCHLRPRSDSDRNSLSTQLDSSIPRRKPTEPGKDKKIEDTAPNKKLSKSYKNVIRSSSNDSSKPLSGVSYSAMTAGDCKSQDQVNQDIKLISTYTSNVRLYGGDCDQLRLVTNAISSQQLSVKVLMGIWTRKGPGPRDEEVRHVVDILKYNTGAASLLSGITVGNEEIFNGRSAGDVLSDMAVVKSKLQSSKINVPVSTVEVGHLWTKELADQSSAIYANLYSFFSPSPGGSPNMDTAAKDVFDQVNKIKSRLGTSKPIIIAETGWPSGGSTSAPHYGPPSPSSQSQFMTSLMCTGAQRNIPYYVMEAFDAKWKTGESVEQHFGLFNDQGQPKFQMNRSGKC